MHTFSLKFVDQEIEHDYQGLYHDEIKQFSFFYIMEGLSIMAMFISFQVYKLAILQKFPEFIYVVAIASLLFVLPFIHHMLILKCVKAAILFSPIQSLLAFVIITEMAIAGNHSYQQSDLFIIILLFMATASVHSYS